MSTTYGTWIAVKFISYDNPTNILRKSYETAAIYIVRSNWSEFRIWNAYLNLVALGHLRTPQNAPDSPKQPRPTNILRQSYENPTTKT